LAFLLPVLAFGIPVAGASAAPATPKLVVTDPPSSQEAPANFTLPSVIGEAEPEDGVILEGVLIHFESVIGPVWNTVEKPTANPNYEIQIFDSTECRGSAIAQGTAATLEGVGIPVAVNADSKTALSAIQVDPSNPSEPSGCSNVLSYWEGNVPPEPGVGGGESDGGGAGGGEGGGASGPGPTTGTSSTTPAGTTSSHGSIGASTPAGPKPNAPNLHLLPSARANDLNPLVAGSAPGAESVAIYGNANCSGAPVAKGTPSQLSAGFEVSVGKNSSTIFSAVASAAQHRLLGTGQLHRGLDRPADAHHDGPGCEDPQAQGRVPLRGHHRRPSGNHFRLQGRQGQVEALQLPLQYQAPEAPPLRRRDPRHRRRR
jgi:hypothetical protein